MIDRRWQIGHFGRRSARLGLAIMIVEAYQRILISDVERAVDQREPIRRVQVVGEDAPRLVSAIAVRMVARTFAPSYSPS